MLLLAFIASCLKLCAVSYGSFVSLRHALAELVEELVQDFNAAFRLDIAMQVGWSNSFETFAVGAGRVPGAHEATRPIDDQDTFLFGSGTKSVTAVAVMRLIDAGVIKPGDRIAQHIDPYLARANQTTLEKLFGPAISRATVLDITRMSAGIPDFEVASGVDAFDSTVLRNGNRTWSPYAFIHRASTLPQHPVGQLDCAPSQEGRSTEMHGNCSAYSSTSYIVAGLLLAAVVQPQGEWADLNLQHFLPHRDRMPSLSFPTARGHLQDHLTVPGKSFSDSWGKALVFEQNPSILGFTCGNMIGSARDVARFFFDLLDSQSPARLVSDSSLSEMKRFTNFTHGAYAHLYKYGAGLFLNWATMNSSQLGANLNPDSFGYVIGHGGDTYGFASYQGYVPELRSAFSVVVNTDFWNEHIEIASIAQCRVVEIAAKVMTGQTTFFNCTKLTGPTFVFT